MKVLWITPNILPAVSKRLGISNAGSGGWLGAMASNLKNAIPQIDLYVLTLYGSRNLSFEEDGVSYHIIPDNRSVFKDNKSIIKRLCVAISRVKPDIIDVQGVEFHYAKYIPIAAPRIPIAATIQGLTSEIYKHYWDGISLLDLIKFRTLKDNLFLDGMIERKRDYIKRGISELEALSKINYFIGRTSWDRAVSLTANPKSKYFFSQRNIREEFYQHQWSRSEVDPFTIFIPQAHAPFKGFHIVLHAAVILRKFISNLKIHVAGRDMIRKDSLKQRLKYGGYQKYIDNLIKKNNLSDIVRFTGPLNASQMAECMSRSHVFVLPSFIENSPNSLGEAQLIGVPSVAAFVGGVPDMITHNETGFLYNASDSSVLAMLVHQIFFDDNLAERISIAARKTALKRYNPSENGYILARIYQEIYDDFHNQQKS